MSRAAPPLRVAVNISGKQLNGADIVDVVGRILAETRCDPRLLGLEITESAVMADPRDTIRVIQALHELGLEVTLDDFGTGYSSMAYLKRFALDRLKIDATFVRGTPEDKDDVAIVPSHYRARPSVPATGHRGGRGDYGAARLSQGAPVRCHPGLSHQCPAAGTGHRSPAFRGYRVTAMLATSVRPLSCGHSLTN